MSSPFYYQGSWGSGDPLVHTGWQCRGGPGPVQLSLQITSPHRKVQVVMPTTPNPGSSPQRKMKETQLEWMEPHYPRILYLRIHLLTKNDLYLPNQHPWFLHGHAQWGEEWELLMCTLPAGGKGNLISLLIVLRGPFCSLFSATFLKHFCASCW